MYMCYHCADLPPPQPSTSTEYELDPVLKYCIQGQTDKSDLTTTPSPSLWRARVIFVLMTRGWFHKAFHRHFSFFLGVGWGVAKYET